MTDVVMERVRELRDRGVAQLDQLEVVITMARAPSRRWTKHAIAEGALLSHGRVVAALTVLERVGVVTPVAGADGHVLSGELDLAGLRTLHTIHAVDRARIVNAFFSCNLAVLREFAGTLKRRGTGGP